MEVGSKGCRCSKCFGSWGQLSSRSPWGSSEPASGDCCKVFVPNRLSRVAVGWQGVPGACTRPPVTQRQAGMTRYMGTSAPHGCCLRHPTAARVTGQPLQPPCQHHNIYSYYGMLMREELHGLTSIFTMKAVATHFTLNKNFNRPGRHGQK